MPVSTLAIIILPSRLSHPCTLQRRLLCPAIRASQNTQEISVMAQKPHFVDVREREQRQRTYQAVPTVAEQFPTLDELAVEMRFLDPEGKVHPSPSRRLFAPSMQAFFDFQCPMRECSGGGYNMTTIVPRALTGKNPVTTGKMQCKGQRQRVGTGNSPCLLELTYEVVPVAKE